MSSIDATVPPTGGALLSEEIRDNFATAKSEITSLELAVGVLQSGVPASTTIYAPVVQGRLTTETGVPDSTSDRSSQSTLYFTPYKGSYVTVFGGTVWETHAFSSDVSLALSGLTSGKNYDVFINWTGSAFALSLGSAWTDDTTRADALGTQNGIYVNGSDATKLYIGTIRTSSTSTTEDTQKQRFVWNYYNQRPRRLYYTSSSTTWNYTTATWRYAEGSSSSRVEYVAGLNPGAVPFWRGMVCGNSSANIVRYATIGVNCSDASTIIPGLICASNGTPSGVNDYMSSSALYTCTLGYHYFSALEWSAASGTTTWYGSGGSIFALGVSAAWLC